MTVFVTPKAIRLRSPPDAEMACLAGQGLLAHAVVGGVGEGVVTAGKRTNSTVLLRRCRGTRCSPLCAFRQGALDPHAAPAARLRSWCRDGGACWLSLPRRQLPVRGQSEGLPGLPQQTTVSSPTPETNTTIRLPYTEATWLIRNNANVFDPFTNVGNYHNGNFHFLLPALAMLWLGVQLGPAPLLQQE